MAEMAYRSHGVDCERVAPVLATVFAAQNDSRLRRWLGGCCLGGEKLVSNAICWREAYIRGALRIFENKPPLQSGLCLLLKKGGGGLFLGGYGITLVWLELQ